MKWAAELSVEFARLAGMSLPVLHTTWSTYLGGTAPNGLPKSLLSKLLAYRLQGQQLGDLPKHAVRFLDHIADTLEAGNDPAVPYPSDTRLKPGVVLVREHDGVQQRVMVLEHGYAWNGKTYGSLSSVAKAITGTNWNGQRFFGLVRKGDL